MQSSSVLYVTLCMLLLSSALARRSSRRSRSLLSASCQAHYDRHAKIHAEFVRKSLELAKAELATTYVKSGSTWNLATASQQYSAAATQAIATIRSKLPFVTIRVDGDNVSYGVVDNNTGSLMFQQFGTARCLRASKFNKKRSLRVRRRNKIIRKLMRELNWMAVRPGASFRLTMTSNAVKYGFTPLLPFFGIFCPTDRNYDAELANLGKLANQKASKYPTIVYDNQVYVRVDNGLKQDFYLFGAKGGSGLPGARVLRSKRSKIAQIRKLLKELADEYESN